MYLKSQIEAISTDTERVEKELYTRFQRILEQCEKMKSLP